MNYKTYEREKHATISVLTFRENKLSDQDKYLCEVEQNYQTQWLKPMLSTFSQEWKMVKAELNASFHNRGKNILLECLQFGGNQEFWDDFPSEDDILWYFKNCHAFAVKTIGYKQTDKNIICAVIVTEKNRRNLFVYYLPITNRWQRKVISDTRSKNGNLLQTRDEYGEPIYRNVRRDESPLLCHSEFWKQRGGEISYSDLQEKFYNEISRRCGAKRGESTSRLKYTTAAQIERFHRKEGDDCDIMPPIKGIWI